MKNSVGLINTILSAFVNIFDRNGYSSSTCELCSCDLRVIRAAWVKSLFIKKNLLWVFDAGMKSNCTIMVCFLLCM